MLRKGTIAAEHIWKRFHADRKRPVLRDEIERLRARRQGAGSTRWRWALHDVALRVEPGEAVGLFGSNGSGKSTLLKILTRVMYPYAGRLEVAGRVGALIEVRAGIHPDLTGRENIFLYGSLLGLHRSDVRKRFDEIVDFAELADAVDRPVKFYSSGMAMRLGFAVAAFLEPDILLVDEVLAVGDASFQQKCLNRMRSVLADGTTLVFVSHDLPTVEATCLRGVWLDEGEVRFDGPVREALAAYRQAIEHQAEVELESAASASPVRVVSARVTASGGGAVTSRQAVDVELLLQANEDREGVVWIGISEGPSSPVFVVSNPVAAAGRTRIRCEIESLPLPQGRFFLWTGMLDGAGRDLMGWQPATSFDVVGAKLPSCPPGVTRLSPVYVDASWTVGTDVAARRGQPGAEG